MRSDALYLGKNVSQRLIALRLFMLVFIYLFNDAVRSSEHVLLNGRLIGE
jgi:hypothetical protein